MKKDYPKAAIIIPTYNRARLIMRTLQSALNQNYQNFEVIIVDDSRNDETEKMIKTLNDRRIKYIHNVTKGNLPKARNQGVRESSTSTKYVAFLDDDNELLPEFLNKSIAALESDTSLMGAAPMSDHRFDDGTKIGVRAELHGSWNTGLGNGSIFRKELFTRQSVWFDEKLSAYEDWDFGLRVMRSFKMKQLPDALQIYYHHYPFSPGSTLSNTPLPIESIDYLFNTYRSYYTELGSKGLAFFYFRLGTLYSRAGAFGKGRKFFIKAFSKNPKCIYVAYYVFWNFPWFARRFYSENVTYRLLKLRQKFIV